MFWADVCHRCSWKICKREWESERGWYRLYPEATENEGIDAGSDSDAEDKDSANEKATQTWRNNMIEQAEQP